VLLVGQLWLLMCMILLIVKWWPLRFVTCSLGTPKLNKSCEQSIIRWWWRMSFQNQILRDSWLIVHKPIGMLLKLFMVLGTLLLRSLIRSAVVYSIGLSHSIGTPNSWSNLSCKVNTTFLPPIQNAKSMVEVNLYVIFHFFWSTEVQWWRVGRHAHLQSGRNCA
jgi:hypothetical protein